MAKDAPFTPDWVSPPGDTIAAILEERGVTPVTLASKLKWNHDDVTELLEGRAVLTDELATQLAALFGPSTSFWTKRESQYREDLLRLAKFASTEQATSWLSEVSGRELVQLGWIKPFGRKAGLAAACLHFFGVPSVLDWRDAYKETLQAIAFRTSKTFVSQPGAVAAWLRQGEIRASDIDCAPWNPDAFRAALQEIRALTRIEDPGKFLPELVRRCAACGVAVVVLRAPKECKASGASLFLTESKAMLLLSVRHLSDDHFWFTFFHEAGHLILHGHKFIFVDGLGCDDKLARNDEDEANRFAEDILIPPEHRPEFLSLRSDKRAVMRFARKIGISRGLVVGQLQHYEIIPQDHLNGLKYPFRWVKA
jgi:plasmid maintenance system antidote protein VapI/Zn-dependent peptidase ImmA (M78 family)